MSKNSRKLLIYGQSYAGCSLERVQKVICTNSLHAGTCETVTFLNVRKCCACCVQASAGDGQGALYYFSVCVRVCVGLMLRPLPPEEPRVAVFVQDRDVTDSSAVLFSCHLFTRSSDI